MKKIELILIYGILIFITSCNQYEKSKYSDNTNNILQPNPKEQTTTIANTPIIQSNCNYDKVLSNPETHELAKQLFYKTAIYSDEPLSYFDNLKNEDKLTREFYFRVLTNSYKFSNGAYAEGLGNLGKEYIENNLNDFTLFFENKICFSDKDLETWAQITLFEFEILESNIDVEKDISIVNKYCEKLIQESEQFSESQKETINKFSNFLLNEWSHFEK